MSYASERWEILRAIGYPKIPMCVRCGCTTRAILTTDHRAGDGFAIRKPSRKTGFEIGWVRHKAALAAARDHTAPEKYQVLCHNDNILKKKQNGENVPGRLRAALIEAENRQWGLFDEIPDEDDLHRRQAGGV